MIRSDLRSRIQLANKKSTSRMMPAPNSIQIALLPKPDFIIPPFFWTRIHRTTVNSLTCLILHYLIVSFYLI